MNSFALVLKVIAPVFVLVAAIHLVLGLSAEPLLGAELSESTLINAALDSQNRFYGVAFAIYGVLFYVCSRDVRNYATIIYCLLWVFLVAGMARLVSIALLGFPPPLIGILLLVELTFPPIMLLWLRRVLKQ